MSKSHSKTFLIILLKLGISVGLLYFLFSQAKANDSFADLRDGQKHWGMLAVALGFCFLAVLISFVRWFLLVRALEIPFQLHDALRLGFLGYLLNFFSLGSVGGDLFKAVFMAREQPDYKAESVATVIIDRMVGLYALFLVASAAILLGDMSSLKADPNVRAMITFSHVCTGLGAVLIVMLIVPGFTGGRVTGTLGRLPVIGETVTKLFLAIRIYRKKYPIVALALLMSVGVHTSQATCIFLISQGLPGNAPSLAEHFLVSPLAALVGALPLTPSGLGAFEGALDILYTKVSVGVDVPRGQGFIVALAFRVITMVIATVGVYYFIRGRREVNKVIHEAELEAEA